MKKHYPTKFRLKGNQDVAAAFIPVAQTELFRTGQVREKMGVPTYARTIQLTDEVQMHVLLEKGQRIVTITADVPAEEAAEYVEEHVEEEDEYCEPAFLVYRNGWIDDEHPFNYGHKLAYRRGSWRLDPVLDTEKKCGNAAWYHVRDNYNKYYNKTALKQCDLISWDGNRAGAFDSTRWEYTNADEFYSQYRSSAMYVAGKQYSVTRGGSECIGACYLPNTKDKKDYFYSIGYFRFSDTSFTGTQFQVFRFDRDPDIFGPTGGSTVVLTITTADIAAATGASNTVTFHRPGHCAYISKDGIAYISFAHSYPVTEGNDQWPAAQPDTAFNDSAYMITVTGSAILGSAFNTLLTIDLRNATWTATNCIKAGAPRFTYADKGAYSNNSVVGLGAWDGDGPLSGAASGQNDLYVKVGYSSTWKEAGVDQVVRKNASVSAFESTKVSGSPTLITVYGGCDALYEYKLRVTSSGNENIIKGSVTVGKSLRPEGLTNPPTSQPVYSHQIDHENNGVFLKNELVLYKDGEEIWSFPIMEQSHTPWSSSHTKQQIRSGMENPGGTIVYTSISEADDQSTFNYWNSSTFPAKPIEKTDLPTQGCCKYTAVYGYTDDILIQRVILFCHPQIPDLYTYLERRCFRGGDVTSYTVSISYHIVQDGQDTEVWETAKAFDLGPGSVSWRFFRPEIEGLTRNDVPNGGNWVKADNIDITAYVVFAFVNRNGNISMPQDPGSLANLWLWGTGTKGMSGLTYDRTHIGEADHKIVSLRDAGTAWYRRATCAVHHKDFGPGHSDYPYLLYLRHPSLNPNNDNINFTGFQWSEIDTETTSPNRAAYYPPFDEKNPDGQFYSNVLTLAQIKSLTGEDNDFPADFGVI